MNNQPSPLNYDLSRLIRLSSGNMEFVKKMMRLFLKQAPADIRELEMAATAGELQKAKELAHRMKPSVDNMSIESLYTVIRSIELYNSMDMTPEVYDEIQLTIGTIRQVIIQLEHDPLLID